MYVDTKSLSITCKTSFFIASVVILYLILVHISSNVTISIYFLNLVLCKVRTICIVLSIRVFVQDIRCKLMVSNVQLLRSCVREISTESRWLWHRTNVILAKKYTL